MIKNKWTAAPYLVWMAIFVIVPLLMVIVGPSTAAMPPPLTSEPLTAFSPRMLPEMRPPDRFSLELPCRYTPPPFEEALFSVTAPLPLRL